MSGVPRSHNTNPAELFEGTGFAWTMVATGANSSKQLPRSDRFELEHSVLWCDGGEFGV